VVNSKQKGKRGELEAVRLLKKIFPEYDWKRSQQYCGIGDGAADVVGNPNLHIEVKRTERGNQALYRWIDQAITDAKGAQIPVVLTRSNGNDWILCILAEDLPEVLEVCNPEN
tara:strand:- start:852 stop:1190 length:339 start_codon:yes stop_codon:yes gene_type:complete